VRQTLLFALLALALATAQAHARLESAVPPADGTVTYSPNEIRLTFSEPVEPALTGIALTDAAGKKVATGKAAVDPKNGAVLVVPLPQPLAPGTYKVAWHAVAADSHKTTGTFGFTLKP